MPSSFLHIDTTFPTFTGEETQQEQTETMLNYLHILVEQLRYTLNNLDMSNFNSKALDDWSEASTEEIMEQLVAMSAQLQQINQQVANLATRIRTLEGLQSRMNDAEEAIDTLEAQMLTAQGDIGDLQSHDTAQDGRLDTLELWKTGANTDLQDLRTDVNAATAQATANQQAIAQIQTDLGNIGNDVTGLVADMTRLLRVITVDANDNSVFGRSGAQTDIVGAVYINGVPVI